MTKLLTIHRKVWVLLCLMVWGVGATYAQTPFCPAGDLYQFASTGGARIDAVTLAGVTNTTGASSSLVFQDFTATPIPVCVGVGYPAVVNCSTSGFGTAAAVWVDWNGNQTWEASENVFNAPFTNPPAGQSYSFTLTVPIGTTPGVKRVRVRASEATLAAGGACTFQSTWGEAEDYALNVIATPATPTVGSNSPVCVGSALNLTASTIAGATYSWTGPASFTSALQNPSIVSAQTNNAGTYSVTATIGVCTSSIATTTVVVRTLPSASISGTLAPICQGQTVNFPVTLTGTAPWSISVAENGGTPTVISGISASPYTLTATPSVGNRTFTITQVSDANGCTGGAVSGSGTVTVRALPTAMNMLPTANICQGQTVVIPIALTGTAPWTVQYTVNTGSGPVTQTVNNIVLSPFNLTVTPGSVGTTSYALTQVTDQNCTNTATGTTTVTVKQPPAGFIGGNPGTICQGETAVIAVFLNGTAPWSFKYQENNNTPISVTGITGNGFALVTLTVTPTGFGAITYKLTEVMDAGGCANGTLNGQVIVNVKQRPTAMIAGNHPAICQGEGAVMALLLSGTPPWNVEYLENGSNPKMAGPFNSTLELLALTPTMTGTVTYTLSKVIDALGCTTGTVSGSGTVPVKPKASGMLVGTQPDICLGQSATLQFNLTGTAPWTVKYQVNNNAPVTVSGITASPFMLTVTPPTPGMKTYTLVDVTDSGNCPGGSVSGSVMFNVKQGPLATIGGQSTTICEGNAVTFAIQLSGTAPWTVKYNQNGGPEVTIANITQSLYTVTVTPGATGMLTYNLTQVTDASGCSGMVNGSFMVNVLAKPTAAISGQSNDVCIGFSTSFRLDLTGTGPWNIEYSENGGTPIAFNGIAFSPFILTVTPSAVGVRTYTVTKVMDANGCPGGMTSGAVTVKVNDAPTATISGGPAQICEGQPAVFTVNLTGVAPWAFTYSENSNLPITVAAVMESPYTLTVTPNGVGTFNYILVDVFDATACLGGETFGAVSTNVGSINPASATISGSPAPICIGQSAAFTVNLTGGSPWSISYSENGGSPITVNNITVSPYTLMVTPSAAGISTYTLTAMTQNAPCSQTSVSGMGMVEVLSTEQASANISGTSPAICVGQTTMFPVSFTGVGPWTISYRENGGTPFFVTGITANPYMLTVTPSGLGVRTYTLNSIAGSSPCGNAGVSGAVTVQVNANILPTASISTSNAGSICLGQTIPLNIVLTGQGPWSIQYSENNGAPITVNNITASPTTIIVTPSAIGLRNFTLAGVTDAQACGNGNVSGGVSVTVSGNSNAQATILGNATVCVGQTANLTVNLSGIPPYSITYVENGQNPVTINNITSSPYTLVVTPNGLGTRTYTLTNVGDGVGCAAGTVGGSATVTVTSSGTATLSAGPQSICVGQTATFTVSLTGTSPWTINYSQNGGAPVTITGIAASPFIVTVTPTTIGMNTFTLVSATSGNQQCSNASVSGVAVIEVSSGITLSLISKTDLGCSGNTGSFVVNAGTGSTYSIDGVNFSNTSGIFTGLAAGNYQVTAKKGGCTATLLVTLVQPVAPTNLVVTSVTSSSAIASWTAVSGVTNYTVGYRVVGATDLILQNTSNTSFTINGLQAGTSYEVVVRANCPNSTSSAFSAPVNFTTTPSATGECTVPNNVLVQVTGPNSATIMWNPAAQAACYIVSYGPINANPSTWPQFLVPHPGNMLQVSALVPGTTYGANVRTNCTTCSVRSGIRSAASATVSFTTSTSRLASDNATTIAENISIYPNPNRGAFTLSYQANESNLLNISVVDLNGRVVYERNHESNLGANEIGIDIPNVSRGVYLVKVNDGIRLQTTKIVVQ